MTGLYNIGMRSYDPISGRWLSHDPIFDAANPNGFSFVGGDPVNYFDPSGRFGKATWNDTKYYGGMAMYTAEGMLEDANTMDAMVSPANPFYAQVHMQMALQGQMDYVNGGGGFSGGLNAVNRYNPLRSPFEAVTGEHLIEGPQLGDRLTGGERATQWANTVSLVASLGTGAPGTMSAVSGDLRAFSSFSSLPRTFAPGELMPNGQLAGVGPGAQFVGEPPSVIANATPTVAQIRNVAQQGYDYAVQNPRVPGLNRMQLGKDAEVQTTRWLRNWAERNDVNLGPGGLQFQVRGASSIPDVVFDPAMQIFDFKLTARAVRPAQTLNFQSDFPGYNVDYIFGP